MPLKKDGQKKYFKENQHKFDSRNNREKYPERLQFKLKNNLVIFWEIISVV